MIAEKYKDQSVNIVEGIFVMLALSALIDEAAVELH